MEPIRPADAHRVTVFGSTLNINATSPGVNSRSLVSIDILPPPFQAPTGHTAWTAVTRLCDIRYQLLNIQRRLHSFQNSVWK